MIPFISFHTIGSGSNSINGVGAVYYLAAAWIVLTVLGTVFNTVRSTSIIACERAISSLVYSLPPIIEAIAGGIPAKVLKYRFSPEMIERLLEIKWWNLPDEEITRVKDIFHKPNPTLGDLDKFFPRNKQA